MSEPRVSVLMPVYNAGPFLRPAMESVLNQQFTDLELVVVDDASTDGSSEVIRSYSDDRIRVISNPTNLGILASRRAGLAHTRGHYVAILDADDVAMPDRLSEQVAYLDNHPEVVLVGSGYEVIDEDGNVLRRGRVLEDPYAIRWALLFGNCIVHSTVTFHRQAALEAGGYKSGLPGCANEDYNLYTRLIGQGLIAQIDAPLAQWRQHSCGTWQSMAPTRRDHCDRIVIRQTLERRLGRAIDNLAVECLRRSHVERTASPIVAERALAVIRDCFAQERKLTVPLSSRGLVMRLALADILRVNRQCPSVRGAALSTAAGCLSLEGAAGYLIHLANRFFL